MSSWYLDYRPQKVEELDCVPARTALEKVIASGKIPSALLFTGPKGIGKTSAARIIAQILNCEKLKGKLGEPCNQCKQCLAVVVGNHLDVLEIDAASNRGIDDIRELRERVKLAPALGRFRIYIIDEVHMLTNEAFNALLKTLEEPPAHAVFVLCTTDPQKLPETIVSRCTRVVFRQATPEEVLSRLERVVKGEKLTVEKGALELLAKEAKGSFRDAVKLLEQAAISGAGNRKVTLAEVKGLLGRVEAADPIKLLELLAAGDGRAATNEIARVTATGISLRSYVEELAGVLRNLLLEKIGVEPDESRYRGSPHLMAMEVNEIDELIRIFTRVYNELRDAVIPQLPLELAAIEWCTQKKSPSGQSVKVRPEEPPTKSKDTQDTTSADPPSPTDAKPAAPSNLGPVSFDLVSEHWKEVLSKVKPKNHSVEALLKASRPLSINDGFLEVEVFYRFHKDRLETAKCRQIVEEAVSEITGVPLRIKYRLGERMAQKAEGVPAAADDLSGKSVEEEIVKAAAEIFKGTVVE